MQRAHIHRLSACRSELFYHAWPSASFLRIFTTSCPLTCLFRQMQASAMAPSGLLGGWKLSGKEVHDACNPSALSAGKCTQHASVPFGCAHSREALDRLVLSLIHITTACYKQPAGRRHQCQAFTAHQPIAVAAGRTRPRSAPVAAAVLAAAMPAASAAAAAAATSGTATLQLLGGLTSDAVFSGVSAAIVPVYALLAFFPRARLVSARICVHACSIHQVNEHSCWLALLRNMGAHMSLLQAYVLVTIPLLLSCQMSA